MNKELMFSSKTDMWATPQDFFDRLNSVFRLAIVWLSISISLGCAAIASAIRYLADSPRSKT